MCSPFCIVHLTFFLEGTAHVECVEFIFNLTQDSNINFAANRTYSIKKWSLFIADSLIPS